MSVLHLPRSERAYARLLVDWENEIAYQADYIMGRSIRHPVNDTRIVATPKTGPACAATAVRQWLEHNDLIGQSGPQVSRLTRSSEPVWTERLDYSSGSLRRGRDLETVKGARS